MKDIRELKDLLNEYRLSRPSDISGNRNLVSSSDLRRLMSNIKRRMGKGAKRSQIVKNELFKFWKKKGIAARKRTLEGFKQASNPLLAQMVEEVDAYVKMTEWWKYDKEQIMSAYYWKRGQLPPTDMEKYEESWQTIKAFLTKKFPPPGGNKKKINEGGNIFNAAGDIHITEIGPTVSYVEKLTGLDDLSQHMLGSTGKREFSGDIDLATAGTPEEVQQFFERMRSVIGQDGVRKHGKMVSLLIPIQGFDPSLGGVRTGQVQTDIMFTDDPEWLSFYYHSSDQSALKGMHRNAAIAALASELERKESSTEDTLGRPVWVEKWKWSPIDGLLKVKRVSYRNERTGMWVKKQKDVPLTDATKNPNEIARVLFDGKYGAEALDSVESIVSAVEATYMPDDAERIYKAIAERMLTVQSRNKLELDTKAFPDQVSKYM